MEIVIGDLAGAILGFAGIVLLRLKSRAGLVLSWLVVLASVVDFVWGAYLRKTGPPRGEATGGWWFVFVYLAPLILVSLPVLIWQLVKRRNEPLLRIDEMA
jgi:hypothetical protein